MPREVGMLFNDAMVRAIMSGTKTVTRRPVKGSPLHCFPMIGRDDLPTGEFFVSSPTHERVGNIVRPPVHPGDRIYVREAWAKVSVPACDGMGASDFTKKRDDSGRLWDLLYRATAPAGFEWNDEPESKWTPSIHMPKWAARTWLDVVSVTVESVQDITEDDARREGVEPCTSAPPDSYRCGFEHVWDATYPGSWQRNDFVWRIEWQKLK